MESGKGRVGHGKGKRGQLLEADEGAEAHRPNGVVIHRAHHDPLSKPVLILDLTVKVTSERALPRSDQPPIFSPLRFLGHFFALSLNKHKRLTTSTSRNSTTDGAAPPVSSSSNRSRQQRHADQFAVPHYIVISLKSSTQFRRGFWPSQPAYRSLATAVLQGQPFVRRAAGRRNLSDGPRPDPCVSKRRDHRHSETQPSLLLAGLSVQTEPPRHSLPEIKR